MITEIKKDRNSESCNTESLYCQRQWTMTEWRLVSQWSHYDFELHTHLHWSETARHHKWPFVICVAYIDPLNWSLSNVIGCLQNNNFLSHVWWSAERWLKLIGHIVYTNDSSNTVYVFLFVGCESNLRFVCSLIRSRVTVRSVRRCQLGVTETTLATTSQITNSKWWMRKSHLLVCFSSQLIMFLNCIIPSECSVSINEL